MLPSPCAHLLDEGLRGASAIAELQTQIWEQLVPVCRALAWRYSGLLPPDPQPGLRWELRELQV